MKTVPSALTTHLGGEVTTLATLWKIVRRDAVTLGFTDYAEDLTTGGVTYKASTGFTRSAIAAQADLSVPNLNVDGVLDSSSIVAADVRAGLYDFAEITVSLVNYADLSMGAVILRTGWLGEITVAGAQTFAAEVRGLSQKLQTHYIEQFSPDCRAEFGDARCGFNLATVTETGTVTGVGDGNRLVAATVSGGRAGGFFSFGNLTFTSGANAGLTSEVKQHDSGSPNYFHFFLPTNYAPAEGDTFSVIAGCAKTLAACTTYANVVNMRAEPWVPGNDQMLRVGGDSAPALVSG